MKELKFNIKSILSRKESWFVCGLSFFVILLHCIIVITFESKSSFSNTVSAEEVYILEDFHYLFSTFVVFVFPILCTFILNDIQISENIERTNLLYYFRLNSKKNLLIRYFLSFLIPFLYFFLFVTLDYLLFKVIFYGGNQFREFGSFTFDQQIVKMTFSNLWRKSATLYTLFNIFIVSIIHALILNLSFSITLFVNRKIVIYFIPFLYLMATSLITAQIGFEKYTILNTLQPNSYPTISSYIGNGLFLTICSLLLFLIYMKRRDQF